MRDNHHPRIRRWALGVGLLLLTSAQQMAADTSSLYEQALAAYERKQWHAADSLAALALGEIDSVEKTDWTYTPAGQLREAIFSGDYVMMMIADKLTGHNNIEIWDPQRKEQLTTYDGTPWDFPRSQGNYFFWAPWDFPKSQGNYFFYWTKNYIYLLLEKEGFLGYKILYFRKGQVEPQTSLLRMGIEEYSPSTQYNILDDVAGMQEKSSGGITFCLVDFQVGTVDEFFTRQGIPKNVDIWKYNYLFYRDSSYWAFIAQNNVFLIDRNKETTMGLGRLPFELKERDSAREGRIFAFRRDSLHIFDYSDYQTLHSSFVHLPYPMESEDLKFAPRIDRQHNFIFQNAGDSLRKMQITEDSVKGLLSIPSLGEEYGWSGDTLWNYGKEGFQLYRGSNCWFRKSGSAVQAAGFDWKSGVLFMLQTPDSLLAIDLASGRLLWQKSISLPFYGRFISIKDGYLFVSDLRNVRILEAETGREILGSPEPELEFTFDQDSTRILVVMGDAVSVLKLNKSRGCESELAAIRALCRFDQGDTAAAVQAARQALTYNEEIAPTLKNDLYALMLSLNMRREANRLAAWAFLETGDRVWRDQLTEFGLEFISAPCSTSSTWAPQCDICLTKSGILLCPFPFQIPGFAPGTGSDYFWFEPPDPQCKRLTKRMIWANNTKRGRLFYNFSLDSSKQRLSWSPTLLDRNGQWVDMGFLTETGLAKEGYTLRPLFNEAPILTNGDRLVTDFVAILPDLHRSYTHTAGIDLSGKGRNWCDTLTCAPVTIGNRCYAHKLYGQLITEVTKGTQADLLGIKKGDIALAMAGTPLTNNCSLQIIKERFPLGVPMDLEILRNSDTLHFSVLNGRIAHSLPLNCYSLVELDPTTGKHLSEQKLPPGFASLGLNSANQLIYQCQDTLLWLEIGGRQKRVTIQDLKNCQSPLPTSCPQVQRSDIVIMRKYGTDWRLAVDISRDGDDSARVLWKQSLEGSILDTDDDQTFPLIKTDGTVMIMEKATGTVLSRETLPFNIFGPGVVKNGNLYSMVSGRLFSWKLAYYHPPFPWHFIWYSGFGVAVLTIAFLGIHLLRVRNLKEKQAAELIRERFKQELETAAAIHHKIIPNPEALPFIEGFQFYGHNYPCREIGGDYFDVIPISDSRFGFVICDVSGKGLPAALLVSTLQATFYSLFQSPLSLVEIAERTNSILYHNTTPDRYATGFFGIMDTKQRQLETINAGHNIPFIVRADGEIVKLDQGGLGFGMFDSAHYESQKTSMLPGDVLYLFTDGISEAASSNEEEFGEERLLSVVGGKRWSSAKELIEEVERTVRAWTGRIHRGESFLHDDFTQLAIKVMT